MKLFTSKQVKVAEHLVLDELLRKENAAANALKAKEAQLNEVERTYPDKIAAKQRELVEIEQRIRFANEKGVNEVSALEERRRQALLPITNEMRRLEDVKAFIEREKSTVLDDLHRLDQQRQLLRSQQNKLELDTAAFIKTQSEVADRIERERREAIVDIETAKFATKQYRELILSHAESRKSLEEVMERAKRAEVLAKAAMAAADQRIAQEIKEQKKTDDKRKMLKLALDVAKKKGVKIKN